MEGDIPRNTEVIMDKFTNVEIFNEVNSTGLSIIRPNKKPITLSVIPANNITVFYPYLKNCKEHDEPQSVANEYLYGREQQIKITR